MKTNEQVSLETVLSEINILGLYHRKLFLMLSLCSLFSAAYCTNYIFAVENVEYRCKYTECPEEQANALQSLPLDISCRKYEAIETNGTCSIHDVNASIACADWVYEKPISFVAEFNIACQEWKRTLIGTLHSAGYMAGLFFVGPISDKFGRKNLLIFNSVAAGVVGIAKSFVTSYWWYPILEFVEPLIGDCFSATHTMAAEMVTKEYRSLSMSILSLSTGIGAITKTLVAWLVPNWRNYLRVIYSPALLFVFYVFFMDESFRWLLNKGKKEELKNVIKRAANMNKIFLDDKRIDNLQSEQEKTKMKQIEVLKLSLTSKTLSSRLFCCIFLWFTTLFGSYSLSINSVSLGGNKYLNYGLLAFSDIPASIILYYLLEKCRRKLPIVATLFMTSLCCMGSTLTPVEYRWLSTTLYIAGRMCVAVALRIVYLYTSELFPTYTRNTMHAWCSGVGRISAVLAPQTPLLIPYWIGLPALLVGMLSLLTACIVMFMPDTSEHVLPDNVEEAEALGKKNQQTETKVY